MQPNDSARKLKMIIISASDENRELIGHALNGMADAEAEFLKSNLRGMDTANLIENPPDVLLIDMPSIESADFEALEKLVAGLPRRTKVFVTATQAEVADIRLLMRLGVSDFIPQPISRSELLSSLDTALLPSTRGKGSRRPTGKIYTVLGAGGGAGATTLAIQIAGELMLGKKKEKQHVCLIDLDIQFGNAAFSLDLTDTRSVLEVLASPGSLDAMFLRSVMAQHRSGLDVLAAPSRPLPLDALSTQVAEQILSAARSEYDYVVVDMPRAWSDWSFSILSTSDLVFLVTNDCVSSLERARRTIRTLTEHGLGATPLMVVANGINAGWGAKRRIKEAEDIVGRPIDLCVRNDAKTARSALARGVFVREVKKQSRIEKDVRKVISYAAKKLQGDLAPIGAAGHAAATA